MKRAATIAIMTFALAGTQAIAQDAVVMVDEPVVIMDQPDLPPAALAIVPVLFIALLAGTSGSDSATNTASTTGAAQ